MQGQTSTLTQCNATRKRNAQTFEAFIASVIDAIRARDHDLGLFAYLAETEALAAARALDAHHKSFQLLPLAGIPIAVKDIIDVAGMPTTRMLRQEASTFAILVREKSIRCSRLINT